MKPLDTVFRMDGFDFQQIDRQGDIATFRKTKGKIESFEVVIVQKNKEFQIGGKTIPAHESMPRSELWGTAGWSYVSKPDAFERVQRLLDAQNSATAKQ